MKRVLVFATLLSGVAMPAVGQHSNGGAAHLMQQELPLAVESGRLVATVPGAAGARYAFLLSTGGNTVLSRAGSAKLGST